MQSAKHFLKTADEFIESLKLQPHPFGCGYFIETDRDPNKFKIDENGISFEINIK